MDKVDAANAVIASLSAKYLHACAWTGGDDLLHSAPKGKVGLQGKGERRSNALSRLLTIANLKAFDSNIMSYGIKTQVVSHLAHYKSLGTLEKRLEDIV